MFSLSKILTNKYIFVLIVSFVCYIITHLGFTFLSGINYIIILFVILAPGIDDDNLIGYSIVFGLCTDFVYDMKYIGVSILFFICVSLIKIFSENKFDVRNNMTVNVFSFLTIVIFNVYIATMLGYNILLSAAFILKSVILDFIIYILSYYIVEFGRAFRSIKR